MADDPLNFDPDDEWSQSARIEAVQARSPWSTRATDYYLGVNGMETLFGYRIKDQNGKYVPGCPRTYVGFEPRRGVVASAWKNLDIRDYLLKNELATSNGGWRSKITNAHPGGALVAGFFEDMMIYRWKPLLNHFSIGPTMMLLTYTGPDMGGQGPAPGRPTSWEELHNMYIKEGRIELLQRIHTQLHNGPNDDSDGSAISWIRNNQTGGDTQLASEYWFGIGRWASRSGAKGYRSQAMAVRMKTP
jgi:hypothetical protein